MDQVAASAKALSGKMPPDQQRLSGKGRMRRNHDETVPKCCRSFGRDLI
jgi:hypothetical protein